MKQRIWFESTAAASLVLCMGVAGAQTAMRVGRVPSLGFVNTAAATEVGLQPGEDPQAKDDLLEGLDRLGANAKERNEVNLDKNMLALAGGKKGGHYADLAQKMDFITVRNYEFATKGQYQKSDLDALRHRLDGSGWSHVVRNESVGETNDIVIKADREGMISDMVVLNAEPRELNIVHLRGHFRMEDVQGALGATTGISMGALGSAMGSTMGHVAAIPQQPVPPEPPPLKKR